MVKLIKSSFVWQFAGGFVVGALGLFALQPHHTSVATTAPAAVAASAIAGQSR